MTLGGTSHVLVELLLNTFWLHLMNVKSIAMACLLGCFFFFFCLGKGYVRVSVGESFSFAEKINWIVTGSATRM